jgi:microcompartment protein CcmL/EutN
MTKGVFYKYAGQGGEVVSPVLLPMPHTNLIRLVAEDGKEIVKDGVSFGSTLDVLESEEKEYTERLVCQNIE